MALSAQQRGQLRNPGLQAFMVLRTGFVLAPILFGIDKFFDWMVNWSHYLAPWIDRIMPGTAHQFMYGVGGVEILAGLIVLMNPKIGSLIVAAWLGAIVINLLTNNPPEYYDIALRDFGLMLGALALNRLATAYQGAVAIGTDTLRRAA
jgi:hypothetical protein